MTKYKICFWLNAPSAHHSEFFTQLNSHDLIENLQIRYFDTLGDDYVKIGWNTKDKDKENELQVENLDDALKSLKNFNDFIHIVMGPSLKFNKYLIAYLVKNDLRWIHWSERFGIQLAAKLNYNILLFKLLRPLYLLTKKKYGKLVQKNALGAFSQGELAQRDFKFIGIKEHKISNLFYTTEQIDYKLGNKTKIPSIINFLYVGRLNKRKGIYDLLMSFSKLKDYENWTLTLIGNDETNGKFSTLSNTLNLNDRICFLGCINHSEVHSFMKKADVFILPSRFDGWGAVLNEAILTNLPIISTDQTGSAFHVLQNNKNGFRVKAGKIESLKKSIEKYLMHPDIIVKHNKASQQLCTEFTPKKNVNRFVESLQRWDV